MQTSSLEHTRAGAADAIVRHALGGTRHAVLSCAAVALRRMIVEDVLVRLSWKCLILSPNAAVQARWLDRQGAIHGIEEAARRVWGEHTSQLVSPLPLSNAPVLTLAWQSAAAAASPETVAKEADRVLRHFVKHSYRLIVVDGPLPDAPLWRTVVEGLRTHIDAFVLQLQSDDAAPALLHHDTSGLAASNRNTGSDIPVFGVPLPIAVRSRLVMPVRHLAWIADETATGVRDVLALERDDRRENLRAVVVHTMDITDASLAADEPPRILRLLAALHEDSRTEVLQPLIATGATLLCADSRVIPLLSEAQTLVRQRGWDVRLTGVPHGQWTELDGSGSQWNSRTYMHLVSWLLLRGATRCLIADPALLAGGWEALTPTTIIDCEQAPILTLYQGDGVRPLDENALTSAVNHWSIIATGEKGDIAAEALRLSARFTPADDDTLEAGVRDLDLLADAPSSIESFEALNQRMIARIPLRDRCAAVWRAVPVSSGRVAPSLVLAPELLAALAHIPFSTASAALERDLAVWRERRGTQRFRHALWGVLASGGAMSAVLLLPLMEGGIAAAASLLAWMVLVIGHGLSIRGMRAHTGEADGGAVALRLAEAVRRALMETGVLHQHPPSSVEAMPGSDGSLRIVLDAQWDARTYVTTLAEALPGCAIPDAAAAEDSLVLFTIDHRNAPLRTLHDDVARAALRIPAVSLPLPSIFKENPAYRAVYLEALRDAFGAAEWVHADEHSVADPRPASQRTLPLPEQRWIWM